MGESSTFRIVLLGKGGNGKSSLANTIFGETKFKVKNFNDSNTSDSETETKCMNGRHLTLIDTPGFLDPVRSEEEVEPELMRCFAECAPGPHIFLIVLKVEKYTEQEKAVVNNICKHFSGDPLKYAAVVFTHGDQLPEGMKIEEYVNQSEGLKDLVEKCGGRCHVFDCKYWKNNDQEDDYRSNQFQVAELLNTIDKILMENTGGHYTNTVLKEMEREIKDEEERIKETSRNMSKDEIRKMAKANILKKQMTYATLWVKGLVGVAVAGLIGLVSAALISSRSGPRLTEVPLSSLETVNQEIIKIGEVILTEVPLPSLQTVNQEIIKIGEVILTEVPLPSLETVNQEILKVGEVILTKVPLPSLETVNQEIIQAGEVILASAVEAGKQVAEIAESSVQLPVSTIEVVAEVGIENKLEAIFSRLWALFEGVYNPFNPFE